MKNFYVWELRTDIERYERYLNGCSNRTPYHEASYLLAEEKAEESPIQVFLYDKDSKYVIGVGIVRSVTKISYMQEYNHTIYDFITPHEYSGILTNNDDWSIQQSFFKNFYEYCLEYHIIFAFIRINPFLTNLPDVYRKNGYCVHPSCQQVYVDLCIEDLDIWHNYRSNVQRNIKRAIRDGLSFECADRLSDDISIFEMLYKNAMNRLGAKKFLYFNHRYFTELIICNVSRLFFVRTSNGNVAAAGIVLLHDGVAYYHLGCFDPTYSASRPMNYLMHSMILWSKAHGCRIFHLGGGGNSLMQFKSGYSNTRISYCVASMITMEEAYREVCEYWQQKFPHLSDEKFEPLYRCNED